MRVTNGRENGGMAAGSVYVNQVVQVRGAGLQ